MQNIQKEVAFRLQPETNTQRQTYIILMLYSDFTEEHNTFFSKITVEHFVKSETPLPKPRGRYSADYILLYCRSRAEGPKAKSRPSSTIVVVVVEKIFCRKKYWSDHPYRLAHTPMAATVYFL